MDLAVPIALLVGLRRLERTVRSGSARDGCADREQRPGITYSTLGPDDPATTAPTAAPVAPQAPAVPVVTPDGQHLADLDHSSDAAAYDVALDQLKTHCMQSRGSVGCADSRRVERP